MAIKLVSLGDAKKNDGIQFTGYGFSGVGKTPLIDTLKNPLVIDTEHGLSSLKRTDIVKVAADTVKELDDVIKFVCSSDEMRNFTDIAVDSASKMSQIYLTEAYKEHNGDSFRYPPKAFNNFTNAMTKLRSVTSQNIFFICHCDEVKDEEGVTRRMPAAANGRMQAFFQYEIDIVFAVRKKIFDGKEHTILQCQNEGKWVGRDRNLILGKYEEADLSKLIKKIKGGN